LLHWKKTPALINTLAYIKQIYGISPHCIRFVQSFIQEIALRHSAEQHLAEWTVRFYYCSDAFCCASGHYMEWYSAEWYSAKSFFCVCNLLNYILPSVILVKVILLNVVAPSYRFIVLAAQDDLQFGS